MADEVDKEEMKRALKEANIYEENLSDDLLSQYYKAIKNSETSLLEESTQDFEEDQKDSEKSLNDSANELLEAISNSESVAPSKKKRYNVEVEDEYCFDNFNESILHNNYELEEVAPENNINDNNNTINLDTKHKNASDTVLDKVDEKIGYNDMPPSQQTDLLKISYPPRKFTNIQNSQRYLTARLEHRAKILNDYHLNVLKLRGHYARRSVKFAPRCKVITIMDSQSDRFVNPLISSLIEEENQLSSDSTYVSRSGRLTKRKAYQEFDGNEENVGTSKKSKGDDGDECWMAKVGKTVKTHSKKADTSESSFSNNNNNYNNNNNNNYVASNKATNTTRSHLRRSDSPDSSQDIITNEAQENFLKQNPPNLSDFDRLKQLTPTRLKPRTYQRRVLSNEEIMNKSNLFKDVDLPKNGRTGAILSAAKIETEKQKQQEEEITKFTETLNLQDTQILDESDEEIELVNNEVETKRRVVPPLPTGRRNIHSKKRGGIAAGPLHITTSKLNSMEERGSSSVHNGAIKKTSTPKRLCNSSNNNNNNDDRSRPSTSSVRSKKDANMATCPLCALLFPLKEIEQHASTCGEDVFPQMPQAKRITCEVCETVVPFSTDYEVHVKACVAKQKAGGLI